MKKLIVLVLAILMLFVFVGCKNEDSTSSTSGSSDAVSNVSEDSGEEEATEEEATEEVTEEETYTIGVTMQGLSAIFMQYVFSGIKEQGSTYDNIELICVDSEDAIDKQISQVENFITQGVDAVILSPVDHEGCAPCVDACVEAGIPIITVNAQTSNQDLADAFAGTDPVQSGEIQAQYVADVLNGAGNVAIINGAMGHFVQLGRHEGYENVLSQYPDINIVFDGSGEWQTDVSMALMETWLQTGTQIDAVLTNADVMTMGALTAIQNAGLEGQIILTGMDCIEDVMQGIEDGTIACSVWQDAIGQGKASVDLAVAAIMGEEVEDVIIPYTLCTIDNIDDYYKLIEEREEINNRWANTN